MIELEVTARQNYNGKSYRVGDHLTVDNEADAADLIALNMAVRKKVVAPVSRDMRPLPDPTPTARTVARTLVEATLDFEENTDSDKEQKGQYKRRDMKAAR